MRKLFIAAVVVVFVAYCFEAYKNYNYIQLPEYTPVDIDIFDGRSIEEWRGQGGDEKEKMKAEAFRSARMHKLAQMELQPPDEKPLVISGVEYPGDEPLPFKAFEDMAKIAENGGDKVIHLWDPTPLDALSRSGWILRDPIKDKDGGQFYKGGEEITKKVIDHLKANGINRIAVVASGQPVAPQPASMVMVILIFMALVFALKGALWEPLLAVIDHRRAELTEGAKLAKANRAEREAVEEKVKEMRIEARKEYLAELTSVKRKANDEAAKIINKAKEEARRMRLEAMEDFRKNLAKSEAKLRSEVPEITKEIVKTVLGREPEGK